MIAGRELDALVAEKVMGWKPTHAFLHGMEQDLYIDDAGNKRSMNCGCAEDFHPSTEIQAAWQVVEKLKADGLWFLLEYEEPPQCCYASFYVPMGSTGELGSRGSAYSDTAPLAICLAALKACGVEMEKS